MALKGWSLICIDFVGTLSFNKDETANAFFTNDAGTESLRITIGIYVRTQDVSNYT